MIGDPPSFRLSLLDAAADYIDEQMPAAAARCLQTLLQRASDSCTADWLRRVEERDDVAAVGRELRQEVERLRSIN